jgi:hypothetical protein
MLLFTAALTNDCYIVNVVHTKWGGPTVQHKAVTKFVKQGEPHCSAHGCDKICETG